MLEHNKKVKGELRIYKEYLDGKKELAYEATNIPTVGFSTLLTNILTNNLASNMIPPVQLGYLQVGTGAHEDYVDRNFYQLAAPLNLKAYGNFTDLDVQIKNQVVVAEEFVPASDFQFSTTKTSFIKLSPDNSTVAGQDKLLIRVVLDEYTANGIDISECGLFTNNTLGQDVDNPILVAYKAFGITDGAGTSISITKDSNIKLIIEWVITLTGGEYVIPLPYSTSSNTSLNLKADLYLPASSNDAGNSWVCYFPDPLIGKNPPTVSSVIATPIRQNVQKDFVTRLLNKGVGVISCDYNYPSQTGDYPIMTSSTTSNHPVIASSLSPLILSGSVRNAYTEAAQMAQFSKSICSSVNFSATNVVYAGEGFGGTLAAWLAYAPEFSGATAATPYETCSTRALGAAVKDAPLNWTRFFPFRLGSASAVYDFRPFALPKALSMSGTVYSDGTDSVLQSADNDYFQGSWASSAIPNDSYFQGVSAVMGYTDSDIDASGNLFWSSIPGMKNSYQFMEIPTLAKEWYSPLFHASGNGSTSAYDDWGITITTGHIDNSSVYYHLDYSGSSLWALQGNMSVYSAPYSTNLWRTLSGTNLVKVGEVLEPASSIDNTFLSKKYSLAEPGWRSGQVGNTSSFNFLTNFSSTNSFEDPFFGKDFEYNMSSTFSHATSSIFRDVDTTQLRNNAYNYNYPNTNQAGLSAKARVAWIVELFSNYDSWYIPYL